VCVGACQCACVHVRSLTVFVSMCAVMCAVSDAANDSVAYLIDPHAEEEERARALVLVVFSSGTCVRADA